MDKELPISKFSASLLEMSRGVEASALQKVHRIQILQMTRNWSLARQGQSSTMVSEEARRHEVYCLTMRVTCNVGPMAASKDLEVPPHAW